MVKYFGIKSQHWSLGIQKLSYMVPGYKVWENYKFGPPSINIDRFGPWECKNWQKYIYDPWGTLTWQKQSLEYFGEITN